MEVHDDHEETRVLVAPCTVCALCKPKTIDYAKVTTKMRPSMTVSAHSICAWQSFFNFISLLNQGCEMSMIHILVVSTTVSIIVLGINTSIYNFLDWQDR
jgi:hypothetical protein